jgi:hypothetical protein
MIASNRNNKPQVLFSTKYFATSGLRPCSHGLKAKISLAQAQEKQ